jgi:hypothetical protein
VSCARLHSKLVANPGLDLGVRSGSKRKEFNGWGVVSGIPVTGLHGVPCGMCHLSGMLDTHVHSHSHPDAQRLTLKQWITSP